MTVDATAGELVEPVVHQDHPQTIPRGAAVLKAVAVRDLVLELIDDALDDIGGPR